MEEVGGTIGISMFQMFFVPGLYRMAAGAAYDVKGEIIPSDYPNTFFMAMRQPAGVVSCFGPFDVPYTLRSVICVTCGLREYRGLEAVGGSLGDWRHTDR